MLSFFDDALFVNKFVPVQLPTKRQIFARTGQRAVAPGGSYTGDEAVHFKDSPTSGLNRLLNDAEAFETPKKDDSEK